LINRIINEIKPDQIVVLSDYAKGMLDDSEKIISKSNQINCRVLVDPKSKDFSKYRGAWLLKPNFKEFTAAVGDCVDEADIHSRARELIDRYEIRNILITCGVKGMILVNHCGVQNFPAKSINVFDVTGAGDTVIAALATLLDSGKSLEDAIKFAIDAAACAVSKNGTQIVSILDIENLRKNKLSILTNGINLQGEEKIVFTNGCFDILHAGHVRLLEKAKELGTSLIVGLNSDNSVRRLKGNGRPINDQEKRKKVLSSLGCVDKVIIFEQDTPLELIKKIRPDVLVKGADYKITEIVGKDLVIKNGGIVKTIELVENLSTTKIVQDISNGK
jgi:D-beta-D-heptose 7-phosphate kinase / D-beta-D-heptose 1-phosphate adenosyltransferase